MKDKLKVVFVNKFDINVFDEYFYKYLLNNVVKLIKEKNKKT